MLTSGTLSIPFIPTHSVVGDLTNPLLQLQFYLRETKQYTGRMALAVDTVFLVLFTAARVFGGLSLLYVSLLSPKIHWFLKLNASTFCAMSVLWFVVLTYRFAHAHILPRASTSAPRVEPSEPERTKDKLL